MKKVTMNRSVAGPGGVSYQSARTVEVPAAVARSWIACGAARGVAGEDYDTEDAEDVEPVTEAGGPAGSDEAADDGLVDLKLAELRNEADKRDLPTSGTKADLIERIREADTAADEEPGDESEDPTGDDGDDEDPGGS